MPASAKILIVDNDPRTLEAVIEALSARFATRLTCVSTAEEAFDIDLLEPHDLAIAEINLAPLDGLTFAGRWRELRPRPILLMSNQPNLGQAVEAIRLGAADYFVKPLEVSALVDSAERALTHARERERTTHRQYRLRALVRRVIVERRDLQQRIDLLCKDLVGAHRRLVHRFLDHEKSRV